MNNYETIFIIADNITDEQKKVVIDKVQDYLNNNAKITETEDLGLRKLAYEVRNCTQGYFYSIKFKSKPEVIFDLKRIYKITDEIIKFITVRQD